MLLLDDTRAEAPAKPRAAVKPQVVQGFKHIPSLDGLRALSFGIVFVAHAGAEKWIPGGFGVTVFFFLSGFLITTLMRAEHEKKHSVSLKAFYLRRVLRILPPFYLVLTVATVICAVGLIVCPLDLKAVAAQFFHFANYWISGHGYSGQALGTGVYWSLAVEEHYYLAFPLLFIAMQKLRLSQQRQALVLYGLCAAVLAWRCWLVFGQHSEMERTYLSSDTRFDSILFGAALAVNGNPVIDKEQKVPAPVWKYALLPLSIAVLLFTFVYRDDAFRETLRYTVQGLALTPIFVCAMRFPEWGPFKVLNLKMMTFIGALSYSLYLTHQVILFGVQQHFRGMHPVAQGALTMAASIAVSWAIYVAIEKPCAGLRKRLEA